MYSFNIDDYFNKISHKLDKEDKRFFKQALDFAYKLHKGQARKSGEPYITHPCSVAEILCFELELYNPELLAAALLHDVVEDVEDVSIEQISNKFGNYVASIVDGCTKLKRYHMDSRTLKDLTHSKIFLSASQRMEVFLVKLADRLHNLRTLNSLHLAKRQRIALETIDIYVPIAVRLNIYPLKRKLFNQALIHLYPKNSRKILNYIDKQEHAPHIKNIYETLIEGFYAQSIPVNIDIRSKGLGSFYDPVKKTLSLSHSENCIDFIIVLKSEAVLDCYQGLGVVNGLFPPIPRKLRDFIANPKSNNYQSLHVRNNLKGQHYLMIIRTPEMDRRARQGILADWKQGETITDEYWKEVSEQFRIIGEYGGEAVQRKEIIQSSESDEIYLYTPAGEVIFLPAGSIVLDFAYKIHTDIGKNCIGALIHGNKIDIDTPLKDGQVIKILTGHYPIKWSPDIEKKCRTPKARSAVNRQINQRRRNFAEKIGKKILFQSIQKMELDSNILNSNETSLILDILNVSSLEEIFIKIGQDSLSPHAFLYYFMDDSSKKRYGQSADEREYLGKISITTLNNMCHKFSHCCNPYPGQENLIGLLSERGISFHRKECKELDRFNITKDKCLSIQWEDTRWVPITFHVEIKNKTAFEVIQSLSVLKDSIHIRNIREDSKKNNTFIEFDLQSMREGKKVFNAFPSDSFTINWYGLN
ncbi:GTP pyrophosphokinase [Candidatus Magnetomoraceae bacterium gMMP-13]